MNINIPHFRAFLTGITEDNAPHECIVHAVRVRAGKPITFHCHLQTGAHYSLVTIEKLLTDPYTDHPQLGKLQPWDCFSDEGEAITYEYFKFRRVVHKELGEGEYLFTIDFKDNQFSDDPHEFKQFHFIKLDSGHFCACPNNYLLFEEKTFTGKVNWNDHLPKYTRQKEYPSVEKQ